MHLSFRTKIVLDLTMIFLAPLSSVVAYPLGLILGILIALIAAVALVDTVRTHYREKDDFERKLADDSVGFLEQILADSVEPHPSHVVWSSRDDGFKSEMLSETYEVWKKFYGCVEVRDRYFGGRSGFDQEIRAINEACFGSFSEVVAKVPWVKEQQQKRIDDLFERKKHIALG